MTSISLDTSHSLHVYYCSVNFYYSKRVKRTKGLIKYYINVRVNLMSKTKTYHLAKKVSYLETFTTETEML